MKMKKTRAYDNRARLAKAEERKRRIMLCTAELYREKAIGDITLEDVADRAETTVQTILRAFGSKHALVWASIYEISLENGADKPMRHATSDDVPGMVRAMFDLYEMVGDVVIRRLADAPGFPNSAKATSWDAKTIWSGSARSSRRTSRACPNRTGRNSSTPSSPRPTSTSGRS